MKDWKKMLDAVLGVARAAAPVAGPAGIAGVALAEQLAALIDRVKEESPIDLPPDLVKMREQMDARMNAKVDATIDKLRGEA